MGFVSMIIGIFSSFIFIPFFKFNTIIIAAIGLILGIIDIKVKSKSNKNKGMALAGIILNTLAIVLVISWNLFIFFLI